MLNELETGVLITAGMRAIEERPDLLTEDAVKRAVQAILEQRGYTVNIAWGHERGVDIEATKDGERLLIEAKGDAPTPQMQGNYFLSGLGQLLQRMDDRKAAYGLALPDNPRYRGLVQRLPDLVGERLHLQVFFVGLIAGDWHITWDSWVPPMPPTTLS